MANNESLQNAAEHLFEAMDIYTSKRLSSLDFDKTLICTIVSDENAKSGTYTVTDGMTTFDAFSEVTSYTENTKVYVQVPNGDMANQKIIIGKYVTKDMEYVSYVSPLNSFVDVTENLIETNGEYELRSNDPTIKYSLIWEKSHKDEEDNIICSFKGYERLGIKGNFRTNLSSKTRRGSYGLRLDIVERTEAGLTKNHCFYLDSNEMYGNSYQYLTYFPQEQLFNISYIFEIISMRLVFYQKGDFFLEDGTYIDYTEYPYSNLFVQDPYVSLGYDVNSFEEDTVLLGTHDSLTYSTQISPQNRTVYMRWIHDTEGKFYSIDQMEEIPEGAEIHWYRYKIEQDRKDELAGIFWQEIQDLTEDKFSYTFKPDNDSSVDGIKVIIEYPSRKFITEKIENSSELRNLMAKLKLSSIVEAEVEALYSIEDSETLSETYEKLKNLYFIDDDNALNIYDEIYSIILEQRATTNFYTSKDLTFTNEILQTQEAIDLIQSLSIEVDRENQEGVYRLYDETNYIINTIEATKDRVLKAQYSSVVTGVKTLDSAEEITWYIPASNTMIHYPIEGKEYSLENEDIFLSEEKSGRPGYVAIIRNGTDTAEPLDAGLRLIEIEQTFRIKDYYTPTASNNVVYCTIKKNNRIYEASALMLFGTAGSNGTEATLLLKMYEDVDGEPGDEVSALTVGGSVLIVPELYDYNNEPIKINKVDYSWKEANGSEAITSEVINNSLRLSATNSDEIENYFYYILQATTTYGIIHDIDEEGEHTEREVKLSAYLPIAVRRSDEYVEIEGATKIIYDFNGNNPRYYKNPYKLYGKMGHQITGAVWVLESIDYIGDVPARRYYPSLYASGEFMPPKMFYEGLEPVCVYCKVIEGDETVIAWTQPLLIIKNKYSSPMLNEWDGNLTIDEKNGTILSAMVGAGVKNDDNTFSGILMGEIGGKVYEDRKSGIGLYGLDHGEQSYGFNVDGTAFIGKSGKGRINFDGNNGTITSGNYAEPVTDEEGNKIGEGIKIDLDDSYMNIYGEGGQIKINAMNADSLFQIKSTLGNTLMNISDGEGNYYIQSDNFSSLNSDISSGMKININDGRIDLVGSEDGIRTGDVLINSSGDPYFRIRTMYSPDEETLPERKNLLYISKEDLYLQSRDFQIRSGDIPGEGTRIDLADGKITSYKFTINAYGSYESTEVDASGKPIQKIGTLTIDSTASRYPLNINDRFRVDWGGNIKSNYIEATGGTLGGWYIDSKGIYDYNPTNTGTTNGMALLSSGTANDKNLRLAVGSFKITGNNTEFEIEASTSGTGFFIYNNGQMKCTGATINKATIKSATITEGTITNAAIKSATITEGTISDADIANGTIDSAKITKATISEGTITDADISKGTIDSATIKGNCTVQGTLTGGTIKGGTIDGGTITGGTIDVDGLIKCGGLSINGTAYEPYTLSKTFVTYEGSSGWNLLNSTSTMTSSSISHQSTSASICRGLTGSVTIDGVKYTVNINDHTHAYDKTTGVVSGMTKGTSTTPVKRYNLTFDVLGSVKES